MTNYPNSLDDDTTIYRIDDNVTEIDGTTINQERDAIFAIEKTLGVNPQGTKDSVADRIDVSINKDGYLRSDAVQAVGLVSLPVTDNQVGANAGIKESKLDLTHSTSDLFALGQNTLAFANGVEAQVQAVEADLLEHVAGTKQSLRHKASAIDLDTAIVTGNTSNLDTGVHALDSTLQDHIGVNKVGAHTGKNISLDTSGFVEIPHSANDVQAAISALDNMDAIALGTHRSTMHGNGVPRTARVTTLLDGYLTGPGDGYSENYDDIVVPVTPVNTHLADTYLNLRPVDDFSSGDDIIDFASSVDSVLFQTQFKQVKIGDWIFVNYGNGVSARYLIDSVYFDTTTTPKQARVRINGTNLYNATTATATAIIFKKRYDDTTFGVLAVAPVNSDLPISGDFVAGSVVVADPRGACILGTFFDPKQLDSTHYNLYLEMYFKGAPTSDTSSYQVMPAIDVTGNQGATPWAYTVESIVEATNNSLRKSGFNYRMIAFAKDGKFGIMMADVVDKAAFSIVKSSPGDSAASAKINFKNNVVDVATNQDGLGFGATHANVASPAYNGPPTNINFGSALLITPRNKRTYVVNGAQLDYLAPAPLAVNDGYFVARIDSVKINGYSTEVQYYIAGDHTETGFKPGMTIVVAPSTYSGFNYINYGRFIIKDVVYAPACTTPEQVPSVTLTVVNGIHGAAANTTPYPDMVKSYVRVYFGNDSVAFDRSQIFNDSSSLTMHRLYEIYVTDKKTTFAHERARLQRPRSQTATTSNTELTDSWHIRHISPKFRGYVNTIPAGGSAGEWVGFFVSSYDDQTGEFVIRLCQADDITILLGPETRSRKNVPFRLYGYNGPDYIEMEYTETGAVSTVIETNLVSNVQIFPTMSEDEEVFLLSSCEVNWQRGGQLTVHNVTDRRQFGNINERDFTNSAQDYMTAVTRAYVPNGVIRGLDFVTNTDNTITLSGGSSVINGSVVNTNDSTISLAPLSNATGASSTVLICVDIYGNVVSNIWNEDQLFVSGKFIPTTTLTKVIDGRKDLLPLYIVRVVEGPQTFVSYIDIRKYAANNPTQNLILKSDSVNALGNFKTLENAINYVNYYDNYSYIEVVGTNVLSSTLKIDLFGSKNLKITGNGSGTILSTIQTADPAMLVLNVGSLTLDGLNLVSTNKHDVDSYVNAENRGAFILIENDSESYSGFYEIYIQNCVFTGDSVPPSIIVHDGGLGTFDSLFIENNVFSSSKSAICLYNAGSGYSSGGLLEMYSVIIKNNNGNGIASCMIGSTSQTMGSTDLFPIIDNLVIDGNNFSVINATCSRNSHVSITNNTAKIIANNLCLIRSGGTYIYGTAIVNYNNGFGILNISNNLCASIQVVHVNKTGTDYPTAAHVSNNTLKNYTNNGFWSMWLGATSTNLTAIAILSTSGINDPYGGCVAICEGNRVTGPILSGVTEAFYAIGIHGVNTNITNNVVEMFSSVGIWAESYSDTLTSVIGNRISRILSIVIQNFIKLGGNAPIMCVHNILSHCTPDQSSTTSISGANVHNSILFRTSPPDVVIDNIRYQYNQYSTGGTGATTPPTPPGPGPGPVTETTSLTITGDAGFLKLDGNNSIIDIVGSNAKINANEIGTPTLGSPTGVITVKNNIDASGTVIVSDFALAKNAPVAWCYFLVDDDSSGHAHFSSVQGSSYTTVSFINNYTVELVFDTAALPYGPFGGSVLASCKIQGGDDDKVYICQGAAVTSRSGTKTTVRIKYYGAGGAKANFSADLHSGALPNGTFYSLSTTVLLMPYLP